MLKWNFNCPPTTDIPRGDEELLQFLDNECTADSRRTLLAGFLNKVPIGYHILSELLPPQARSSVYLIASQNPENVAVATKALNGLATKLDPGNYEMNNAWYVLVESVRAVKGLLDPYNTLISTYRRVEVLALNWLSLKEPDEKARKTAGQYFMQRVRAAVPEKEV